jgi:hypothetical protein
MRNLEAIVCVAVVSFCISGCAVDAGGNGDNVPHAASQAINGQGGDSFRVGVTANSAGGSCIANDDSGARCNLRGAFNAAAHAQSPVTIDLLADSTVEEGEIDLPEPACGASYHVIVRGVENEPPKAIAGFGTSRFIRVPAGVTLDLVNVNISGFAASDEGGTILNYGTVNLSGATISESQVACDGVGAMNAEVSCGGGAISNHGTMTVGSGTRIEKNRVVATASTAAVTIATAIGGGIVSDGILTIEAGALFALNSAQATATSGAHGMPSGATASAFGGAIFNAGGKLAATAQDQSCSFFANTTWASASALEWAHPMSESRGGAIASVGGTFEVDPQACLFKGNAADVDFDVYSAP